MFEIVDGRRTDGRTTEHGYTISSPCEPEGSSELKKTSFFWGGGRSVGGWRSGQGGGGGGGQVGGSGWM